MPVQCPCNARAMPVQCPCNARAMHVPCHARAMPVPCPCHARAMLLSLNQTSEITNLRSWEVSKMQEKTVFASKQFSPTSSLRILVLRNSHIQSHSCVHPRLTRFSFTYAHFCHFQCVSSNSVAIAKYLQAETEQPPPSIQCDCGKSR